MSESLRYERRGKVVCHQRIGGDIMTDMKGVV